MLAIILLNLGVVCFLILYISKRPGGTALLFSNKTSYGRRWGTLYDSLNENRLFLVVPLLSVVLVRSAIVCVFNSHSLFADTNLNFIRGFGQGHGFLQVVALTVLEAITAVSECLTNATPLYIRMNVPPDLFYWHPYYSKGYNLVNYLLQTMKVISNVLLILFVPSLNFNVSSTEAHNLASIHNIPKVIGTTIIGIVLLVLNSIVALVLVALTVLKMGMNLCLSIFLILNLVALCRLGCSVVPVKTSWF